jgi:hypothetical protein
MRRHLAAAEMLLAAGLWALALTGLATGREPFVSWLYHFAWWPYLLFLDGILFLLRGESWLLTRPREFLRLLPWSVSFWLVFEAFNLVLKNWRYVGVPAQWWLRWPGYALAFATVLPGLLLTAEVLAALGLGRQSRGRPRALGAWQVPSLLLGTACLALPLAFPQWAFGLIWLAFILLLDPLAELLGGESLIAKWAAGERREHLCLLAAGLICGLWWEAWNYPATARWVYNLPVLNFGKVFEMPVLGYLGFLPFALEVAVMYNFVKALDDRVLVTRRRRLYAVAVQVFFWIIMFATIDKWTVLSFQK